MGPHITDARNRPCLPPDVPKMPVRHGTGHRRLDPLPEAGIYREHPSAAFGFRTWDLHRVRLGTQVEPGERAELPDSQTEYGNRPVRWPERLGNESRRADEILNGQIGLPIGFDAHRE